MNKLSNIAPIEVFRHFEKITQIPHGSGNEKALSDYILNFAKKLGLWAIQDETDTLIIRKPASAGYENSETVILQGHLDMVCEKNNDTVHDFLNDPLDLYIDEDWICAKGTTLGADNGIAIAYAMALMEGKDLAHPRLEFILTTNEEAGMDGAKNLDPTYITGTRLINLDSEDEGVFLSSCAGGMGVKARLYLEYVDIPSDYTCYKITLGGLRGGHSGLNIHEERGNANRLLGWLLSELQTSFLLADFAGGSKTNAIPREAWAAVFVKGDDLQGVTDELVTLTALLQKTLQAGDELNVEIKPIDEADIYKNNAIKPEITEKLTTLLISLPSGVAGMSAEFPELVETSSNLGVVHIADGQAVFAISIRSSVESRKIFLANQIESVATGFGAKFEKGGSYPGWQYNPSSQLREVFLRTYKEMHGKDARVEGIHAGLECGLFAEKKAGLDMIAMGPDMRDVHSPDERLSISSTRRTWEFLLEALKNLK